MAHLDFVSRHPGVPRILLTELQRTGTTPAKQLAQEFLRYEQQLYELIETGKTFGEITPYVSESATALFVGTIQGRSTVNCPRIHKNKFYRKQLRYSACTAEELRCAMKRLPKRLPHGHACPACAAYLSLFIYVVMRSGPLAPVPVRVATVQTKQLHPQLFGIGLVEAHYSYRIGPVVAGPDQTCNCSGR